MRPAVSRKCDQRCFGSSRAWTAPHAPRTARPPWRASAAAPSAAFPDQRVREGRWVEHSSRQSRVLRQRLKLARCRSCWPSSTSRQLQRNQQAVAEQKTSAITHTQPRGRHHQNYRAAHARCHARTEPRLRRRQQEVAQPSTNRCMAARPRRHCGALERGLVDDTEHPFTRAATTRA